MLCRYRIKAKIGWDFIGAANRDVALIFYIIVYYIIIYYIIFLYSCMQFITYWYEYFPLFKYEIKFKFINKIYPLDSIKISWKMDILFCKLFVSRNKRIDIYIYI